MSDEPRPDRRMGRLASGPHPELSELLYEPHLASDRRHVLPRLLDVDAAHLVMLARRELLPADTAGRLLTVNRELARRCAAGEELFAPTPGHRGLYMLYEGEYVRRLGKDVGGAAHVARSRNDINATVTRMRLRDELLDLVGDVLRLVYAQTDLAARHTGTLMSAFTHMQPAQPSSFGHYLSAVSAELLRSAADLADAYHAVDRCPMGAAAGLGTSFPVDRRLVARLLGFTAPVANSLDAVASRDYAVRVLAPAAQAGTTLSRLALDLQSWGSAAFGFLDWPDGLVSTSSIMPQKRNAYVFENVRGQAVVPIGALANTLAGFKNTPYSNSVEVSGEASSHLWPALAALRTALRLTRLMVSETEVRPEVMEEFLHRAGTTMTAVADLLVRDCGLAFRTAHDAVARLVAEDPDAASRSAAALAPRLRRAVRDSGGGEVELEAGRLARALDPRACLEAARHGGGPAPTAVEERLAEQRAARAALEDRLAEDRSRLAAAGERLRAAAQELARPLDATEETP